MDATSPALDVLRALLLSLLLVLGGVGAASPAGAAGIEEVVATASAPATVGLRRRQLARRFDAIRRRRRRGDATRLRPTAGRPTRGRSFPASVRGPPAR